MLLRAAVYLYSALLIVAMYFGVMSHSRPGAMTWGPTTDFWASAIAISHIEHGLGGGLGYRAISYELARQLTTTGSDIQVADDGTRALVAQPDKVEAAFQSAARIPRNALQDGPIEGGTYVTTWAEDIGFADFYEIAFRIFGYHALSTYSLFFSILMLSFLLFAGAYADDDVATVALGLAVTGMFLTGTANIFYELLPNQAANRYLAMLTLLPCLHLLIAGLDKRPLHGFKLGMLIAQAALYGFTVTFRTPAIWTAIAGVSILLAFALIDALRSRGRPAAGGTSVFAAVWSRPVALSAVIVVAAVGVPYLRDTQLNKVYFNEAIPHHLTWHPAIAGLSIHPEWPRHKPSADISDNNGDLIAFKTFENYMKENRPGEPITSPKVLNLHRARLHDSVMRMKLVEFARANPWYMVELYFYYKPQLVLAQLRERLGTIPVGSWMIAVPMMLMTSLLLVASGVSVSGMLGAVFLIWLSSLLPAIFAYSALHVIAEKLCCSIVLILTIGVWGLVAAARTISRIANIKMLGAKSS